MPKTPPLIIPNTLPNDWISRSKINKSNHKVKNIFAAQTTKKQLRFDETEELQYSEYEQASTEINDYSQNERQSRHSPPPPTSELFYFNTINATSQSSSFKQSQQDVQVKSQSQHYIPETKEPENHNMDIDQTKHSQDQMTLQRDQNFNSFLTDISSEFQQFMEEHRQIKKSIEDKRNELEKFTKERMNYLDERQAYFQSRMKSLKEFY